MIQVAKAGGKDYKFLVAKLLELQAGEMSRINDTDPASKGLNKTEDRDELHFTALHYASLLNSPEIIEVLLQLGANIKAKDTEFNATPLHWAVLWNNLPAVHALLKHVKQGINEPAEDGLTPLHTAAYNGQVDIFQALLSHADIDISVKNYKDRTPLFLAVSKGHMDIFWILLPHLKIGDLAEKDGYDRTLLHVAASEGMWRW